MTQKMSMIFENCPFLTKARIDFEKAIFWSFFLCLRDDLKVKKQKYYRMHDITKPQPSQKSPHTGAKSTAHRRENHRRPPRRHLLPYTAQ